ncbi:membrane-bound lytic murein transglycosylase MltF [Marinobacterium sp. D7]|uniref:membrane-bound lytic murein transglycosylase MltF n=1 Tax=Marinobacterium ramblicola TaxID=2849041 RepID=UPI001C2D01AA|nr:membrane-bound lytic murein transglycosylase MltF [Marinobacterium ramblicola]MBV1787015.1 membrane-bound lytic murein transglycosylase MltF [Marinobacterium ramblicola]
MFVLRQKPYFRELVYFWGLTVIAFLLTLISINTPTQVEAIKERGVLRVATRNTPMTYYIDKGKPAGFEYELASAFADYLGVRLELILPTTFADLFTSVRERNAHIAAANLTVSEKREKQFLFGPTYRKSAPTVIYRIRQGQPQPHSIEELYNSKILVLAGSAQAELLARLKHQHPPLEWEESDSDAATDLLDQVHDGSVDYTVMDSTVFDAQRSFYPGLNKGFELEPPQPIAWMLAKHYDGTLKRELDKFFALPETQELIKSLEERYFSRQNKLNFFDTSEFRKALEERYPPLEQYFMLASQESGIDHLLLAAIAYQESHWREDAVSPTGVKGIMMLTEGAATEVGVADRTDPRQSILGGAQYLVQVRAKIPERITEPDHTWFALAGYNIGFGHLEDARILTQRGGKDPDRWQDVREFLPLLANEKYYSKLRYGYARGYEPVTYVANIRKYMEMLRWEEQVTQARNKHGENGRKEESGEEPDTSPNKERPDSSPVSEISPTL